MSTDATQTLGQLADQAHDLDDKVVADQATLTADQASDTATHQQLYAGVSASGLLVRKQADGSALVLVPDGNGGLKSLVGVFDDAPVPAPPSPAPPSPTPDPAAAS